MMFAEQYFPPFVVVLFNALGACGVAVGVSALLALQLDSNADVRALGRYGSPREVFGEIEQELADVKQVVCIGSPMRGLQLAGWRVEELQGCRVLLTPSWLVYLWGSEGHRLTCMRWRDLVVIFQVPAIRTDVNGFHRSGSAALLIDCHDVRLEIVGTELAIARLMANLLPRAPWALDHVDTDALHRWAEHRDRIITEVEQRRSRSPQVGG
jgi:hypothetical protein